jgi:hypothetical protein
LFKFIFLTLINTENRMAISQHIIIKCEICPFQRHTPPGIFDPRQKVTVQLSNGERYSLFEFYPDEVSFKESELIGLTLDEAKRLKFEKDIKYLRSEKVISRY